MPATPALLHRNPTHHAAMPSSSSATPTSPPSSPYPLPPALKFISNAQELQRWRLLLTLPPQIFPAYEKGARFRQPWRGAADWLCALAAELLESGCWFQAPDAPTGMLVAIDCFRNPRGQLTGRIPLRIPRSPECIPRHPDHPSGGSLPPASPSPPGSPSTQGLKNPRRRTTAPPAPLPALDPTDGRFWRSMFEHSGLRALRSCFPALQDMMHVLQCIYPGVFVFVEEQMLVGGRRVWIATATPPIDWVKAHKGNIREVWGRKGYQALKLASRVSRRYEIGTGRELV